MRKDAESYVLRCGCVWTPLELVFKILVTATPKYLKGRQREGPGHVSGWLGMKQSRPQEGPDQRSVPGWLEPLLCSREPPGAKGTTRTRLQMATQALDELLPPLNRQAPPRKTSLFN